MASGFFHESTPYGPLIHTLKLFRILVRILGDIRISKLFCGVTDDAEHKKKLSDRGLFKHGSYMPWVVYFIHADDFRKVSL